MIAFGAFLLMTAAAPADLVGTPLGAIPRQTFPAEGCAAYLWTASQPRVLLAMAGGSDGRLRLSLDGLATELARIGSAPAGGLGFAGVTNFAAGTTSVALDLTVEPRSDLSQGAAIPSGTIRVERPGRDGVIVPVVGLIGCAGQG